MAAREGVTAHNAASGTSQGLAHDHPDLVCAVCMQAFNTRTRKPIDIGCHTYCEACILASPSSFRRCPECRAAARNPHINYALMRLLGSIAPAGAADSSSTQAAGRGYDTAGVTANGHTSASQAQDSTSIVYGSSAGLDALQAELGAHPVDGPAGGWGLGNTGLTAGLSSLWQRRPDGRQTASTHMGLPAAAFSRAAVQGDGDTGTQSDGGDVLVAGGRPSRRSGRHRASVGPVQPAGASGDGPPGGVPGRSGGGLHLGDAVNSSQHLVHAAVSHLPDAVQEARSQFWSWAGPLMGLLYLVSPLDLIPDFIPLLGWLDDMVVVGALLYWVCTLARAQQQRRAMSPPAPPPTPQPY